MTSIKHANAAKTTVTRDVVALEKETGNIYETVAILGKRADQISTRIREEVHAKMEEFAVAGENLEEVYENREQIELSKMYERMPKPSAIAVQEFAEGKVYFRRPDEEAPGQDAEAAPPAKA